MKLFIVSQPKSGTYLCSNLLIELGFKSNGLHLTNKKSYYQYNLLDKNAFHESVFRKYKKIGKSLEDNLKLIEDNSFGVGHIYYNKNIHNHLQDFKLIYVYRNNNERIESYKRYNSDFKREIPKMQSFKESYKKILPWSTYSFNLSFDDMINKNITKIDNLQMFLYGKVKYDSKEAITSALNKPSLTKSSIRQ